MDKLYVVTASLADTGKGWLTATIASLLKGNPIKIDPSFDVLEGLEEIMDLDPSSISTDAETYQKLGLNVRVEDIIRAGELEYEYLSAQKKHIRDFNPDKDRRCDCADKSEFLESKLEKIVETGNYKIPVIEIGGSIYDDNIQYLIDGIRRFANYNNVELNIILLSYLEKSDDEAHLVKVTRVVDGIRKTAQLYWKEPSYVFVRDRATYGNLSEQEIKHKFGKIAHKTHIQPNRLIYLPEFESLDSEVEHIKRIGLFDTSKSHHIVPTPKIANLYKTLI